MRRTGQADRPNGEREGEREKLGIPRSEARGDERLGSPLRMPMWMPDEGDGWILIIHSGGKAIYLRDDLPTKAPVSDSVGGNDPQDERPPAGAGTPHGAAAASERSESGGTAE